MSIENPTRSRPGRKPSIATHPACAEIELARAAGDSLQMIADRFGVGRASVDRYWHALPPERRARLTELAAELRQYEAPNRGRLPARSRRDHRAVSCRVMSRLVWRVPSQPLQNLPRHHLGRRLRVPCVIGPDVRRAAWVLHHHAPRVDPLAGPGEGFGPGLGVLG